MILRRWDDLPQKFKNEEVKTYYDILTKRKTNLVLKRAFDIIVSLLMIIILSPIFLILSIWIKLDSKGPVMFRQVRITQYGKEFKIFKFRTMVNDAEKLGTQVTTKNDARVTNVGKFLRKVRLDEIPQLLNILTGDMTFVGTRPEVIKYVDKYSNEMLATLLLPAGVTSEASIEYKDEEQLLSNAKNADETYVREVLPNKMRYNLDSIKKFSFFEDIKVMINTAIAVVKK